MEKQKKQSLVAAPGGKSYLVPFILITSLFLLWGFAHGLLDVLNKHFQRSLHDDQSRERLGAILYVYRLFLDGVAGGSVHETLRI